MTATTPFKALCKSIRPIIKKRREFDHLGDGTVNIRSFTERPTCLVCGNLVGTSECKGWGGPEA